MRTAALIPFIVSATFAFAGDSPKQAILPAESIPKTTDSHCGDCLTYSGLFIGGGVEYLFEADTAYYTGKVGYEWASNSSKYSQSLFLEVGWFEDDGALQERFLPVTVNYEYKRALTRCLSFYIGGGVGVAFSDTAEENSPKKLGVGTSNENETVFAAQAFAGLTYCVSKSVEIYGGVRYLWTDEVDQGSGVNDWSIGAGIRVKF